MRFVCGQCKKVLSVDDDQCGASVLCGHCKTRTEVPLDRFETGAILHDFCLEKLLGQGRTGFVYLARQVSVDRQVALRVLRGNPSADSEIVVGLVRETRASSRLEHANIAQSIAVGEEDGIWFQAMEYVNGLTLEQLVREHGLLAVKEALDILRQAAEALGFAWENHQLVFRSFNPLSMMLDSLGRVKLVDFSAAYVSGNLPESEALKLEITPYTCPEEVKRQKMDVRSDIYSLGATTHFLITGRSPYDQDLSVDQLEEAIINTLPVPAHELQARVPELVGSLLLTMMAKNPDHRPADVAQLLSMLERVQTSLKS